MTIYKFAGFWRRLGAYTVDCTIIFFIFYYSVYQSRLWHFFPALFPETVKTLLPI